MLRRGNHNSAKFWRRVLLPVIDRYRDRDIPKYFRGDAAFAIPGLYGVLEEESFQYTIGIPSNDVLMGSISHLLTRPVGRPSYKPKVFYASFSYQAQSWDRPPGAYPAAECAAAVAATWLSVVIGQET